jgi:hypothetical protein
MTSIGGCEPSLQPGSHHVIIAIVIRVTASNTLRGIVRQDRHDITELQFRLQYRTVHTRSRALKPSNRT